MPYKSRAQAAYFNIHRRELEAQGVNVDEWNAASRGMKLPKKKQGGGGIPLPRRRPLMPEDRYNQQQMPDGEYPHMNDPDDPIAKILRRGKVYSLGEELGDALSEGIVPPEMLYMQKGIDPSPYQGDKNTIDPQYLGNKLDLYDTGQWPDSYQEGGPVRYFKDQGEEQGGKYGRYGRHGFNVDIPLDKDTYVTGSAAVAPYNRPGRPDFDARLGIIRRFADGGYAEPFGGEMSDLASTQMPETQPQAYEPLRKAANVLDVRPEDYGGRTSALFRLGSHLASGTVDQIKNLMGESEKLRTTGEYEGGPGFDAALSTAGASMPFAVRGALGTFGGKLHSAAEKAVRESKTARATPEQWMGELKNKPGVKQEELDYMELKKFFDERAGTGPNAVGNKITREELADYMKTARPELTEKTYGGVYQPYEDFIKKMENKYGRWYDTYQLSEEERELFRDLKNERTAAMRRGEVGDPTKYGGYTTGMDESNPNYFEAAAVLQGKKPGFQEIFKRARQEARQNGDVSKFDDDILYRQQYMDQAEAFLNDENRFVRAHDPYPPDTLFHRRGEKNKDIEGKKTYVVQEFQSDLHQGGQRHGYRDPETIAQQKQIRDEAQDRVSNLTRKLQKEYPNDYWDFEHLTGSGDRSRFIDRVNQRLSREEYVNSSDLAGRVDEFKRDLTNVFNAKETYRELDRGFRQALRSGEYPERPFKSSWEDLAAKRSIKEAIDTGHEQLIWFGGKDHAMRYGRAAEMPVHKWHYDDKNQTLAALDNHGGQTRSFRVNLEEAAKMVNKDDPNMFSAENIRRMDETGQIESKTLDKPRLVGAEHHYMRYDQRMPKIMEKIGKKWGVKPERIEIEVPTTQHEHDSLNYRYREGFEPSPSPDIGEKRKTTVYRLRFTPEMIEDIKTHGLPMKRGGAVEDKMSAYRYQRAAGGGTPGLPFNPATAGSRQLVRNGLLHSNVAGRTDKLNIKTPSGSYVIPADIVSGLGQGNTLNGATALQKMFTTGPLGMKTGIKARGVGHAARLGTGKMPKGSKTTATMDQTFADGGPTGDEMMAEEHAGEPTPIDAAGGEYLVHPAIVRRLGNGNLKQGHKVLDQFVLYARDQIIDQMQNLKPPVGSAA